MKIKSVCPLYWTVTVFAVLYFVQPGLLLRACVPNPTNYCQFAKGRAVPIDQITNLVPTAVPELAPAQPQDDRKVIAPIIFFVIMLIVFAYIIYQLIKLLDKVIPPPEKKPDPPPNSGNTNYPPIVMNPTDGPGPALSDFGKKITITTNTPSWGTITNYDIRSLNYLYDFEKFGTPSYYDRFWSTGILTTTNMIDWEDSHYRVDCYVNSQYGTVCYVYKHYGTNWWNCYYTSGYVASNHMAPAWFNLSDRPYQPNQFFKLDPK